MTAEQQYATRGEFLRLHNMSENEMLAHFASHESDRASINPRNKLDMRSGLSDGKEALRLKRTPVWTSEDYTMAEACNRKMKFARGRRLPTKTTEGAWTPHAIALMNRGHKPQETVIAESKQESKRLYIRRNQ